MRGQGPHIIGVVLHVGSLDVKCVMLCVTVILDSCSPQNKTKDQGHSDVSKVWGKTKNEAF